MISQYDLYDLTYAFLNIRNDIQYEMNIEILSRILVMLEESQLHFGDNQVRKAIAAVIDPKKKQWSFTQHNNIYVNCRLVKETCIYDLLVKLCKEMILLLEDGCFENAYDLIDCFHCVPEIIADNHFSIPKSFWNANAKQYRKKWCKNFLKEEEKKINHC